MSRVRAFTLIGLIWFSWFAAASYPLIRDLVHWRPEAFGPEVPYLLLTHGTKTDVMSSVSYFVWILVFGTVCCIPTEVAKFMARSLSWPAGVYFMLVGLQLILLGDTLRTYSYDWWRYLLSLSHLRGIEPLAWMDTSVARVPWISAAATASVTLLFLSCMIWAATEPRRSGAENLWK